MRRSALLLIPIAAACGHSAKADPAMEAYARRYQATMVKWEHGIEAHERTSFDLAQPKAQLRAQIIRDLEGTAALCEQAISDLDMNPPPTPFRRMHLVSRNVLVFMDANMTASADAFRRRDNATFNRLSDEIEREAPEYQARLRDEQERIARDFGLDLNGTLPR